EEASMTIAAGSTRIAALLLAVSLAGCSEPSHDGAASGPKPRAPAEPSSNRQAPAPSREGPRRHLRRPPTSARSLLPSGPATAMEPSAPGWARPVFAGRASPVVELAMGEPALRVKDPGGRAAVEVKVRHAGGAPMRFEGGLLRGSSIALLPG